MSRITEFAAELEKLGFKQIYLDMKIERGGGLPGHLVVHSLNGAYGVSFTDGASCVRVTVKTLSLNSIRGILPEWAKREIELNRSL